MPIEQRQLLIIILGLEHGACQQVLFRELPLHELSLLLLGEVLEDLFLQHDLGVPAKVLVTSVIKMRHAMPARDRRQDCADQDLVE